MKTLNEQISDVIEHEPVAVFMKGTPQMVMCGNSHRALQALHAAGAPITTVDILPDPRIRQELAPISGWPTIPQVFVKGELIGGADITEELLESGELQQKPRRRLGADRAQDVKVVALELAYRRCARDPRVPRSRVARRTAAEIRCRSPRSSRGCRLDSYAAAMRSASSREIACSPRVVRTVTGPPNGA